jgi:hypothetical protein
MQDLLVALTFIVIVIVPALVAARAGAQDEIDDMPGHRTHASKL